MIRTSFGLLSAVAVCVFLFSGCRLISSQLTAIEGDFPLERIEIAGNPQSPMEIHVELAAEETCASVFDLSIFAGFRPTDGDEELPGYTKEDELVRESPQGRVVQRVEQHSSWGMSEVWELWAFPTEKSSAHWFPEQLSKIVAETSGWTRVGVSLKGGSPQVVFRIKDGELHSIFWPAEGCLKAGDLNPVTPAE